MSCRKISGAIERIRQLSITDPSPDARAAYEVVLNLLSRVDECELADLIKATAPRPLQALPQDWPVITDDMDQAERDELLSAMLPQLEPEGA